MTQISQHVRTMATADLEMVLAWRNAPEVRRYMYSQHEITLDEHHQWFERVSTDPHRHLLIYEDGTSALGFVNIHQIALGGVADWGFYAAPDAPKGTGRSLGNIVLRHAFVDLGLHKLCGQALVFNERSIRFHRMLGFMQEGVLRQQYFDGQHYHDVLCFGLLAKEWRAKDCN